MLLTSKCLRLSVNFIGLNLIPMHIEDDHAIILFLPNPPPFPCGLW